MEYSSDVPFYNRENSPDILGTGKPPFLEALTLMLELSFFNGQDVYRITDTMRRRHAAYHIFTPQFFARILGTEGPRMLLPRMNATSMIAHAKGILKIIIDLRDNFCTMPAIIEKLEDDGYHGVPRDLISLVMYWYQRYQEY